MSTTKTLIGLGILGAAVYLFAKKSSANKVVTTSIAPAPIDYSALTSVSLPSIPVPEIKMASDGMYQDLQDNFSANLPL